MWDINYIRNNPGALTRCLLVRGIDPGKPFGPIDTRPPMVILREVLAIGADDETLADSLLRLAKFLRFPDQPEGAHDWAKWLEETAQKLKDVAAGTGLEK